MSRFQIVTLVLLLVLVGLVFAVIVAVINNSSRPQVLVTNTPADDATLEYLSPTLTAVAGTFESPSYQSTLNYCLGFCSSTTDEQCMNKCFDKTPKP